MVHSDRRGVASSRRCTRLVVSFLLSFGGGCRRGSTEGGSSLVETDSGKDAGLSGEELAPLESVRTIAADEYSTCALLEGGRPVCWGTFESLRSLDGEGGLPLAYHPAPRPLLLPGDVRLREIAMWGQARGLTEDGRVMLWGRFLAPYFVLEDHIATDRRARFVVPVADDLEPYEDVAGRYPDQMGLSTKYIIDTHGLFDSVRPVWSGLRDVERLLDGGCYESEDKDIYCIRLRNGRAGWARHGPFRFSSPESVIIRGPYFACLRDEDGAVYCWFEKPEHGFYEEWDGVSRFKEETRLRIPLPRPAVGLSVGNVACAALDDGSVACWDIEPLGDLTPETVKSLHLDTREGVDATLVVAGPGRNACAMTRDSRVKCWMPRLPPPTVAMPFEWWLYTGVREVPQVTQAVELVVGFWHACALTEDGRVWCWGGNTEGELGRGFKDEVLREHPPALVVSAIDPFEEVEDQQ